MNLDDVQVGRRVRFIPHHAHGDRTHPDCEFGTVTSKNSRYAFVKFNPLNANGQACDPDQLEPA